MRIFLAYLVLVFLSCLPASCRKAMPTAPVISPADTALYPDPIPPRPR